MRYAHDLFLIYVLAVMIAAFLFVTAIAAGASVLYRSRSIAQEIATRRVLGARRAHIKRMLSLECVPALAFGALCGVALCAAVTVVPKREALIATALVSIFSLLGTRLAANRAADTPFSKSGLFRAGADKRGE